MDTPLFALNAIEVDKFIDKWEEHPCLWQVTHPNYRSRVSRRIALQNISDAFGRGWTIGEYANFKLQLVAHVCKTQVRFSSEEF